MEADTEVINETLIRPQTQLRSLSRTISELCAINISRRVALKARTTGVDAPARAGIHGAHRARGRKVH